MTRETPAEGDPASSEDRSQYYRGFVAQHYDLLVPEDEHGSYAFFQKEIAEGGEPALELGCGTGRPLLSYVAAGLDVEGIDSSLDMLERCREKAREDSVEPRLHHDRMESFSLGRRFRTIFLVSSTFMLLPDGDAVRRALRRIREHLEPGGRVFIPLHLPADPGPRDSWEWTALREAVREDGASVRCLQRVVRYDPKERIHETQIRYELEVADELRHSEELYFLLHWHTQEGFTSLLSEAGFVGVRAVRGNWDPSQPSDPVFVFVAEAPA